MAHVVKATPYHHSRGRAAQQGAYISHGEKDVPGAEGREVYGLGEKYKDVSKSIADPVERHAALQKLILEDADRTSKPTFHHHIFTVDDRAAARLAAMDRPVAEQRLRSAVEQTFNASAAGRQMQGMYAIHWDGGYKRGAHPHVHVVYSPLRQDGRAIFVGPKQLEALKRGWNRSVDRTLDLGAKRARPLAPARPLGQALDGLRALRKAHAFAHNPARAAIRTAGEAMVRGVVRAVGGPRIPTPSRRVGQTDPARIAGTIVSRAIEYGYRAVLSKAAVPFEAARAVLQLSMGRGRER